MEKYMTTYYILYNPYANRGKAELEAEFIDVCNHVNNSVLINITSIKDYKLFFNNINNNDIIILCGGDGTINKFINATMNIQYINKIFYYPAGTGNDFYRDIMGKVEDKIIEITSYLKNLQNVTVEKQKYKFINGIGFGIDGYCCQVEDKKGEKNIDKIDYTSIAVKGLLFHHKPTNAIINVDGKEYKFKKVWLASTMNGRYYGGGMMPTPSQKRNSNELSIMIFHNCGKLKTLMIFPSIFKGNHIKHKKTLLFYLEKK